MPDFFAFICVLIEYLSPSLDSASTFFAPVGAAIRLAKPGVELKYSIATFSPISPTLKFIPLRASSASSRTRNPNSSSSSRIKCFNSVSDRHNHAIKVFSSFHAPAWEFIPASEQLRSHSGACEPDKNLISLCSFIPVTHCPDLESQCTLYTRKPG